MTPYRILLIIFILFIGLLLVNLLRKRRIKEQYVWMWFFLDILALIGALLPLRVLYAIAHALGFVAPSNMILVSVLTVLVLMSIHFGIVASGLYEDRRKLTEEVALLKLEMEKLNGRMK